MAVKAEKDTVNPGRRGSKGATRVATHGAAKCSTKGNLTRETSIKGNLTRGGTRSSSTGSGKSPAKKTRNKTAKRGAGKSAGKSKAEQVMSAFKGAHISDVSNKVFVAKSPVHGKGLFAAKRIKAETVLGRLHGMPSYDDGIYVLWITDELGLELTNDLRFINHDKNPNVAYTDIDVTALRDIEPGEELLHDYGW